MIDACASTAKIGITFSNLHGTIQTPLGYNVAVGMMLLDFIWMVLLALYLDQVLPSEVRFAACVHA